jgi:hypothetical protein
MNYLALLQASASNSASPDSTCCAYNLALDEPAAGSDKLGMRSRAIGPRGV